MINKEPIVIPIFCQGKIDVIHINKCYKEITNLNKYNVQEHIKEIASDYKLFLDDINNSINNSILDELDKLTPINANLNNNIIYRISLTFCKEQETEICNLLKALEENVCYSSITTRNFEDLISIKYDDKMAPLKENKTIRYKNVNAQRIIILEERLERHRTLLFI